MMVSFQPAIELENNGYSRIEQVTIDDSGQGVEIRIWSDGRVEAVPMSTSIEQFRMSPLWEEIVDT